MISFAEKYPELVAEWAEENEIRPENVSYGSNKKIIWNGRCGHTCLLRWREVCAGHKGRHRKRDQIGHVRQKAGGCLSGNLRAACGRAL